jgi:hypothetical protein
MAQTVVATAVSCKLTYCQTVVYQPKEENLTKLQEVFVFRRNCTIEESNVELNVRK